MADMQRITTEYIDREDRVRLAGEVGPQSSVVLWLTQRLLNRLLPHLLGWLEKRGGQGFMGDAYQGFAQQAAMATLEPQPPVPSQPQSKAWLVHTVNITATDGGVRLEFRGASDAKAGDGAEPAVLLFHAQPLRQWLGILHNQYLQAGWPLAVWPGWAGEAPRAPSDAAAQTVLH